jgi:succinyl-CoA synthetase beta subunit
MCRSVGLRGSDFTQISNVLFSLYQVFHKNDALLAEINPLGKNSSGAYLALDAKVEIDDSSLYRHPELKKDQDDRIFNPLERKGREIGVTYVELDRDIAIISSGAGLASQYDIINLKCEQPIFWKQRVSLRTSCTR